MEESRERQANDVTSNLPIIAGLVLSGLLVFALVLERRRRIPRHRDQPADDETPKNRVWGFPLDEVALKDRKRTLKVCPDCRELVSLASTECKYCGCVIAVEESNRPSLALKRRNRHAGGRKESWDGN